jgi:hypothetical protein
MNSELRPKARRSGLVVQRSGDETLIYDLQTNEAKCLSSSAAFIWERCDGLHTFAELASAYENGAKKTVSEDFIGLAVSELSRHGLIENAKSVDTPQVSRRQMIRRVGLATAAVLPVVVSIVAPTSVLAQTCIPNNATCTTSAQCCSNCCKNVGGGVNECKPGGGACLP